MLGLGVCKGLFELGLKASVVVLRMNVVSRSADRGFLRARVRRCQACQPYMSERHCGLHIATFCRITFRGLILDTKKPSI